MATAAALALALAGCGPVRLPDCLGDRGTAQTDDQMVDSTKGKSNPSPSGSAATPSTQASSTLIGIDASGSMAGFARVDGQQRSWKQLLQAIKLSVGNQPAPRVLRIGASQATPLPSLTQGDDPCFFGGCGGFGAVTSTLHTLWSQPAAGTAPPLRVMLSDLEVNDGDISQLRNALLPDLRKGAQLGVLAMRLPFRGKVVDSNNQEIFEGSTFRPLYVLISGPSGRVEPLLKDIARNLSLLGFSESPRISMLGQRSGTRSRSAIKVTGASEADKISNSTSIRLGKRIYGNPRASHYQFLRQFKEGSGIWVFSSPSIAVDPQGVEAPTGLVTLSPAPSPADQTLPYPDGVVVERVILEGKEVAMRFRLPRQASSGAFQASVDPGSLPEPWWLEWDRAHGESRKSWTRTDNLLLTLTNLSQAATPSGSPPAVQFCIAFSDS